MTSAGQGWGDFSIVLEGPWTLIRVETRFRVRLTGGRAENSVWADGWAQTVLELETQSAWRPVSWRLHQNHLQDFDLFLLVSDSTDKGEWVFPFSLSEIGEVWTDSSYTPQECWHGKNILRATELKWLPSKTSANVFRSVLWMVVFLFT